jgi:hypothetical protein
LLTFKSSGANRAGARCVASSVAPSALTRSLPRTEALWHSVPIVPRHDPPKAVGGDFPSLVHELAAFLFSPTGLLALVAIIRHSDRVTMAFIATMAIGTSLLICNRTRLAPWD